MNTDAAIYVNADVLTMEPDQPEATAFAVAGRHFAAVGSDEDIRKTAPDGARVIDLGGKTVVPGFIEPHSHISYYALQLNWVDCSPDAGPGIEEVKARITAKAEEIGPGTWIRGFGYNQIFIKDERHLTKDDLDEAAPRNPVLIFHTSGHLYYANSLALEIGGITKETPQPEGGEIDKDERGEPTGLLLEPAAAAPVSAHLPKVTKEDCLNVLPSAIHHFHRAGITSCHDAAIGFLGEGPELFRAYRELEAADRLNLRIYMTIIERIYQEIIDMGFGPGFGSDYVKLGSVKLLQDGSMPGETAALLEPYHHRPDFKGELIMPQEALDDLVQKYHGLGLQMAIHANGDGAVESVLQALEKADRVHPGKTDLRHMIIHCQLVSDDQMRRIKKLEAIPNYHLTHVYHWGDYHSETLLGPERARRIDPLKSTLDRGLRFVVHSDMPVHPVEPLPNMHTAVHRETRKGMVLGPEERISPYEALKRYTVDAAYCSFEEDIKGSIAPGKLADFVVLSDNPLTVPDKIRDIQVLRTVVGGRTVFESS